MNNAHEAKNQNHPKAAPHLGRMAPSPTGLLHLGNVWSFLWAWLWAKSCNGQIVLRMEDIDPQRSRTEYIKAIEQDLSWLGLHWDKDIMLQSTRQAAYVTALHHLDGKNMLYPCYCTRKELRSLAGAPHMDDMGAAYPGTCAFLTEKERLEKENSGRQACLRVRTYIARNQKISFSDAIYGKQIFHLQNIGGDFALRRSDGVMAYQLAVVVDDGAQNISHIVRGCDILVSTPRQIFLQKLLNLPCPHYAHVPLLLDENGERLAKRHSSLSVLALREAGVQPERILGLLAHLAGFTNSPTPIYLKELLEHFSLEKCSALYRCQDIAVKKVHTDFLCTR